MPEAIVALGDGKRFVGMLHFDSDGRRQHAQFEYARNWLAASDRFALSQGGSAASPARSFRRAPRRATCRPCRLLPGRRAHLEPHMSRQEFLNRRSQE